MHSHWLQRYLDESIRSKLCTKIMCTTCSSAPFRDGAFAALEANTGIGRGELDLAVATALAKALAELAPGDAEEYDYRESVRLLLSTVHWFSVAPEFEEALGTSWAASVLKEMRRGQADAWERQQVHERQNDPKNVAIRRENKRREAQERHLARLEAKKDRDRAWWEKQAVGG
jgi:hypothetical protein